MPDDIRTLTFPPGVPPWAQFVGAGDDAPVDTIPDVVAQLPPGVYTVLVARPDRDVATVRLNKHG